MADRKVAVFIAVSLDGYIATKDESLKWLYNVDGKGDNGYEAFYKDVDTVLMGRATYSWLMEQNLSTFPYEGKERYVFTQRVLKDKDVHFTDEEPAALIERLKRKDGGTIWVAGGGKLIHSFLKENLIDEIIVTVAPKLIGRGIPLFREGEYSLDLTLKRIQQFNQFAELYYEVNHRKEDIK